MQALLANGRPLVEVLAVVGIMGGFALNRAGDLCTLAVSRLSSVARVMGGIGRLSAATFAGGQCPVLPLKSCELPRTLLRDSLGQQVRQR